MNKKCQVFTPKDYVEKLISCIEYANPYGKKLLENSCGVGNILGSIVKKYIDNCKALNFSKKKIAQGLASDIYGVEIDFEAYQECINNLNSILLAEEIPFVNWQIFNLDFFDWNPNCKFSYIIGNPPYITYQELPEEDRVYLRKTYKSCSKGKFDYCYAFIEKSIELLNDEGKFAYLIPSSIFKTVYGYNLRNILISHLVEIDDFSDYQIFDKILVKSSIILYDKNCNNKYFYYKNNSKKRKILKKNVSEKWCFNTSNTKKIRFGDFFLVAHSVATLCNSVFILDEFIENEDCILSKGFSFERNCIRDAVSPKDMHYNKKAKIIFPYYYENGYLKHYTESDFQYRFPNTFQYLFDNRKALDKRKSDLNSLWFEYGRSQALSKINKEKLIISTIITDKIKLYKVSENAIPYSGLYILSKSNLSLDFAKQILESKDFMDYVMNIGIHITGNSIRITSKDILNYKFDFED
ncbi:MAG: Eco57I restriction-modification methylase domain-containing protein [Treponema sp.]|nr:Eco57I restriction-modification methylase domain-containing protein [Treponema sp.]